MDNVVLVYCYGGGVGVYLEIKRRKVKRMTYRKLERILRQVRGMWRSRYNNPREFPRCFGGWRW